MRRICLVCDKPNFMDNTECYHCKQAGKRTSLQGAAVRLPVAASTLRPSWGSALSGGAIHHSAGPHAVGGGGGGGKPQGDPSNGKGKDQSGKGGDATKGKGKDQPKAGGGGKGGLDPGAWGKGPPAWMDGALAGGGAGSGRKPNRWERRRADGGKGKGKTAKPSGPGLQPPPSLDADGDDQCHGPPPAAPPKQNQQQSFLALATALVDGLDESADGAVVLLPEARAAQGRVDKLRLRLQRVGPAEADDPDALELVGFLKRQLEGGG